MLQIDIAFAIFPNLTAFPSVPNLLKPTFWTFPFHTNIRHINVIDWECRLLPDRQNAKNEKYRKLYYFQELLRQIDSWLTVTLQSNIFLSITPIFRLSWCFPIFQCRGIQDFQFPPAIVITRGLVGNLISRFGNKLGKTKNILNDFFKSIFHSPLIYQQG